MEARVEKINDIYSAEPVEETYYDTSEKILALSDQLAEEIVIESIGDQMSSELDVLNSKINYVSLFRMKYSSISKDDSYYDEEYLKEALARVATVISEGMKNRYGIEFGIDLDYSTPAEFLYDMETVYEFLFIRHQDNLIDYFKHELHRRKAEFLKVYTELMETDEHSKDLFVIQSKKKFKNKDDVTILHFLNEILNDIKDSVNSAYDLFKDMASLDVYEEYNTRMDELLINYGNKIVLNNDAESAKLYFKPLTNPVVFSEIRNAILISYLEECELDD